MSEFQIMRLPVTGEWWAFEMSELIEAVDELYSDVALMILEGRLNQTALTHPNDSLLLRARADLLRSVGLKGNRNASDFLRNDPFEIEGSYNFGSIAPLQIISVKYGSDGSFDFLGIGKICEAVASMYNKTIDFIAGKPEREGETLENIKAKLAIAKASGLSDEEVQAYGRELLSKHDRKFRRIIGPNKPERLPKPMILLPAPAAVEQRKPPDYR